jgi:hypothetical protein
MIADPEKHRENREMPEPLRVPKPVEVPVR